MASELRWLLGHSDPFLSKLAMRSGKDMVISTPHFSRNLDSVLIVGV